MSETEFENESNVAVIEPPAEKAEKPVRKTTRKPKAEKAPMVEPTAEEAPAIAAAEPEPPALTGPRHYCFHPSRDFVYFSNEQGCSVTAYRLDPATGTLAAAQTITTLPDGRTRLDFINPRPDEVAVLITARRRAR